jgi:hypothetical protein
MLRIVCPRCGRDDQWSQRCWMCDASLVGVAATDVLTLPAVDVSPLQRAGAVLLKITLALVTLIILTPLLLVVTCYGAALMDSFDHVGR